VKRIVADLKKCLACRACEIACAVAHVESESLADALYARGAQPRIYVLPAGGFAVPLQCRHCDDAPCIRVCPTGALSRKDLGAPVLSVDALCIGCRFCVQACPFGVIRISSAGQAVIKCDLCVARLAEGLEPACVWSCPVDALALVDVDDSAEAARARAATQSAAAAGAIDV
jgi:carbon-monoxide dehydrogenase iron sulfur subunit